MMMPHMHALRRSEKMCYSADESIQNEVNRVVFNVARLKIPVGFMGFELLIWHQRFSYGFAQIWAKRGRRGEVGFESRQGSNIKKEVRWPFIIVYSSSFYYIIRIRTNLNTQGKDWVNNFADPLITMEYCDNTLSTYVGGLRWLSFKFSLFFPLVYLYV